MHKVEWAEGALEDLEKLDKTIANRILSKITWFSIHFDSIIPEELSGDLAGMFKLRVGDWRVLYTIEDDSMIVQAIGHRREIYR